MALEIRPEQMLVLERHAYAQFVERALVHLRTRQPQEASKLTPDELRGYIEEAMTHGKELGLKKDDSILEFLELGLLPESFRQSPLVREVITRVLANDNLLIEQRVRFLYIQLVRRAALEPMTS